MTNDTVRAVTATLRVAAEQVLDLNARTQLHTMADTVEAGWDDPCCPLCEETTCDEDCPLRTVRAAEGSSAR